MELPILVTNLNFGTTQDTLESTFRDSGEPFLVIDRETSKSRGFALVLLAEERVTDFVAQYAGAVIDGRNIRLDPMPAASPVVATWFSRSPEECPDRVRNALRAQAQQLAHTPSDDEP